MLRSPGSDQQDAHKHMWASEPSSAIHHSDIQLPISSLVCLKSAWSSCMCVCLYSTNSLLLGCLQVHNCFLELTDKGWNGKTYRHFFSSFPPLLYCIPTENLHFPLDAALRTNTAHSSSALSGCILSQHICYSSMRKIKIKKDKAGLLCYK